MDEKSKSKFLSLILRHKPDTIGIALDNSGWAVVADLVQKMPIDLSLLHKIVREDQKGRYVFNTDQTKIRATQGHSIPIDMGYVAVTPPETLYHGTAEKSVGSIRVQGLLPGTRQYVHLSSDVETATKVGQRHGKPIVLNVMAGEMSLAGHKFYQSENGVWLTEHVPPQYLA